MLYCDGPCGDSYGTDNEMGCQKSDADAYCKLKFCDAAAYATSYEIGVASNRPGFACTGPEENNLGDWFGMRNVYFDDDIRWSHGPGSVVENVICGTQIAINS